MTVSPRRLLAAYLVALVAFLALDAVWLTLMGPRLYAPALGPLLAPRVDWLAAVLFYLLYLVGLLVFAVAPALQAGRAGVAVGRGALFGLVAYATYDLTNQATMRGWPWAVTLADLAWGGLVSATACGVAAWAVNRLPKRFTHPPARPPSAR